MQPPLQSFLGRRSPRLLASAAVLVLVVGGSMCLQPVNSAFSGGTRNPANTWTAAATWCGTPSTTVTPSQDAYVNNDGSAATATYLRIGADASYLARTLIAFTLPATPAGCTLTGATLQLTVTVFGSSGRTYSAFRAAATWNEATATWANQPATTGTAVNTTSVSSGNITWNVLTHVQAHYSGTNYGFVLKDTNEAAATPSIYVSSEGAAANVPKLLLTYT